MNTSQNTRQDRSVLMDFVSFSPSPTLSRELFALVVTVALVAVVVTVIRPGSLAGFLAIGLVAVIMLIRLAVGFATRGYGRGGR